MRDVDARRGCAAWMRGGRGSMEGEGCKNRSRRNGSTGVLGKRGAIVKVKVIRNYDLGEYQSKRVRSRRRYSNRGDRTTERRRDRERRERRKEVKKAVEERRRKGKQWKGNSFPLAEETCETRSLIAFKNREFAPATRKLSENLDSFHWNAFLYPGHRRDSNFSSPPRSHSSRMHRGNCATWPSLHDPLHVLFSMYIYIGSVDLIRARVNKEILLQADGGYSILKFVCTRHLSWRVNRKIYTIHSYNIRFLSFQDNVYFAFV